MKNIFEIMKEFGFELAEDKKADFQKALGGNYITVAEHEKKVSHAEQERDGYKQQFETAQNSLNAFEGIDPKNYKDELAKAKTALSDAKNEFTAKLAKRDRSDAIKAKLDGVTFTSNAARREIMARLENEQAITLKDGALIGFDDVFTKIKDEETDAFGTGGNPARFTSGKPTGNGRSYATKEDILKIANSAERQKAIAENLELFMED